MATSDVQTALANEARRSELRQKIAQLKGSMGATASAVQRLTSMNNDDALVLADAQSELASLEAGGGPGVTDSFGPKSVVTQLIEVERLAAKSACIDYIKANPECSEQDAADAWNTAALASHPNFQMVIQDGLVMSTLYRNNMVSNKVIQDNTWETQRQYIIMTDKQTMLDL